MCNPGSWQCQAGTLYCKRDVDPPQDRCSENDNCLIGQPCDQGCGIYQCSPVTLKAECAQGQTGACAVGNLKGQCGQWRCTGGTLRCDQTIFSSLCSGKPEYANAANVRTWGCIDGECSSGAGNCVDGDCKIVACNPGFADLDGAVGNGCECATDNWASTCASASVQSVAKGGTFLWTGKVETASGNDWLQVNFSGAGGPGTSGQNNPTIYRPKIELIDNAGNQYAMQVYSTTCGALPNCSTSNVSTWEQSYAYTSIEPGYRPPPPGGLSGPGHTGCCSDTFGRITAVKIRVYRVPGAAPTCQAYSVRISNP
jgi:hypothetical protein